ncbi:AAA domain-containing protein [Bacillus cereus]
MNQMIVSKVDENTVYPCYINFTNNALEHIAKLLGYRVQETPRNKQIEIVKTLLASQDTFFVHIEKASGQDEEELYIDLHFDTSKNPKLEAYSKTLNFYGVIKEDGLLIIGAKFLHKGIGQANNRRLTTQVRFFVNESIRSRQSLPAEIIESIKLLPVAREQSKLVKKRLESWEIYLDMIVNRAEQEEVLMDFSSAKLAENLRELIIYCPDLRGKVGNKKLRSATAKFVFGGDLTEGTEEIEEIVGRVRRFIFEKNLVEIELDEDYVEYARQNKWSPVSSGKVHISNYGELAQARRLRNGFRDLQNGVAQNPNLENLLFDEDPVKSKTGNVQHFEFKEAIQENLNKYQIEAVKGALAAEDIYLIQGPPGTGKTTVIAEICYQNAERGLKTLIASQSNLAVDNALSKLLDHPKVRILRKGRTQTIEEEGRKYIEENIAETWRAQTKDNIEQDISEIHKNVHEIKEKIKLNNNDIKLNEERLEFIKQKPSIEEGIQQLEEELSQYNVQVNSYQHTQRKIKKRRVGIEKRLISDEKEIQHIREILEHWSEENVWKNEKEKLEEEIENLNEKIIFVEKQKQFEQTIVQREKLEVRLSTLQADYLEVGKFVSEAKNMVYMQLNDFINGRKIRKRDLNSVEILQLQKKINNYLNMRHDGELDQERLDKEIRRSVDAVKQLDSIINKQERILAEYNYDIKLAREISRGYEQVNFNDVERRISQLGTSILSFNTLNIWETLFSKLKGKRPEKIEKLILEYREGMEISSFLSIEIKEKEKQLREFVELQNQLPELVTEIRNNLVDYYKYRMSEISNEVNELESNLEIIEGDLEQIDSALVEMESNNICVEEHLTIADLTIVRNDKEKELEELGSEKEFKQSLEKTLKTIEIEYQRNKELLLGVKETFTENQSAIVQIEASIMELHKKLTKENEMFEPIREVDVDKEKRSIARQKKKIESTIQMLHDEIIKLNNHLTIKREWLNMLGNAKDYDLKAIRNLYIRYANVIGITCVQSASKSFVEEYPDFDVVIIDEVSKATPPELLLPMLKGKKIILVGDHHQLPPLIGEETLEEVVEKIPDEVKKEEVKAYLKESLFERLFNSLSDEYKTTLRIQYRMHKDIMETITQFYEGKDGKASYGLSCGLENSDVQRDHQLEGEYVKRGQHIMWFDIPHEEEFFERQEAGMTSRYNDAEIKIILEVLRDINQAVEKGKEEGRISENEQKKIGIISFYGEQVRKLKHIVDDHRKDLPHLRFRIGTVDRFQGMESDVIIASFVRNHNKRNDDIGFLNEYRRLNVALSRAKELLVITGSSKMFTQKAKRIESKKMYTKVKEVVLDKNGMRDHKGYVK